MVELVESTFASTATFTGHIRSGATSATVSMWSAAVPNAARQVVHADATGHFVASLPSQPSGPQTVCIVAGPAPDPLPVSSSDPACHRVFIAAVTLEDPAITVARVHEALAIAKSRFDWETQLPGWTVEVGASSGSAGGLYRVDLKQIVIHATPGRSVTELTTTIFHELGHAVDVERLTLTERVQYQTLRGFEPASVWRGTHADPIGRWALPSEDFAETFVVWVTGNHINRSTQPQQTAAELVIFAEIAELG